MIYNIEKIIIIFIKPLNTTIYSVFGLIVVIPFIGSSLFFDRLFCTSG